MTLLEGNSIMADGSTEGIVNLYVSDFQKNITYLGMVFVATYSLPTLFIYKV